MVTATLNGNLQLTDNLAGDTSLLKSIVLSYAGSVSNFAQSYILTTTSPSTIPLPNGSAQFIYIRNLATTAGSNLAVVWTPKGQSSIGAITLSPGAFIMVGETDANNGITSLSLTAAVINIPVEYILVS